MKTLTSDLCTKERDGGQTQPAVHRVQVRYGGVGQVVGVKCDAQSNSPENGGASE